MVQMAFCDLSHTYLKQVTNVSPACFCHPTLGDFDVSPKWQKPLPGRRTGWNILNSEYDRNHAQYVTFFSYYRKYKIFFQKFRKYRQVKKKVLGNIGRYDPCNWFCFPSPIPTLSQSRYVPTVLPAHVDKKLCPSRASL